MSALVAAEADLTLVVNRCGYGTGYWCCTLPDHPRTPDRHYLVHQEP